MSAFSLCCRNLLSFLAEVVIPDFRRCPCWGFLPLSLAVPLSLHSAPISGSDGLRKKHPSSGKQGH